MNTPENRTEIVRLARRAADNAQMCEAIATSFREEFNNCWETCPDDKSRRLVKPERATELRTLVLHNETDAKIWKEESEFLFKLAAYLHEL